MSDPLRDHLSRFVLRFNPLFDWARGLGRARLLPSREPGKASSGAEIKSLLVGL